MFELCLCVNIYISSESNVANAYIKLSLPEHGV
jgi:hypothetical protein